MAMNEQAKERRARFLAGLAFTGGKIATSVGRSARRGVSVLSLPLLRFGFKLRKSLLFFIQRAWQARKTDMAEPLKGPSMLRCMNDRTDVLENVTMAGVCKNVKPS